MNIKTKYNLGDLVYPISTRREEVKVPTNCLVCKDVGKVELNNNFYCCPECMGYTYRIVEGEIEWYLTGYKGIIEKIDVELYDKKYDRQDEYMYMLDSTGVGSGRCWKEENLFKSAEDAQIECDKRNNEIKLNKL
jgi:hypothetical protein